jgi:hypothetical protein
VQRANGLVSKYLGEATLATIEGAAHFMIATHVNEVARLIARHVHRAEATSRTQLDAAFSNHDKAANAGAGFSA